MPFRKNLTPFSLLAGGQLEVEKLDGLVLEEKSLEIEQRGNQKLFYLHFYNLFEQANHYSQLVEEVFQDCLNKILKPHSQDL